MWYDGTIRMAIGVFEQLAVSARSAMAAGMCLVVVDGSGNCVVVTNCRYLFNPTM